MDIIADLLVGDVPHHNPGIWASLVLWACGCEPYDGPAAGPADGRPGGALQQLAAGACAYGGAARLFRLPVAVSACLAAGAGSASQAARADTPLWVLLALDRRMVVLAVVAGVVVPLSLQRHMASLGAANLVGLASLAAFLLCLVWLSGAAVAEGTAHALPWLPDLETLGRTGTEQAIKAFGVLSVLLTANGCHANVSVRGRAGGHAGAPHGTSLGRMLAACGADAPTDERHAAVQPRPGGQRHGDCHCHLQLLLLVGFGVLVQGIWARH